MTESVQSVAYQHLVGGLEHFLFFHIVGIVIPIDFHIFQRGLVNHQPEHALVQKMAVPDHIGASFIRVSTMWGPR